MRKESLNPAIINVDSLEPVDTNRLKRG